jgi:hypothetical protein
MKKASEYRYLEAFVLSNGRCERIRTFDPLHPMLYTACPHKSIIFCRIDKNSYKSMCLRTINNFHCP